MESMRGKEKYAIKYSKNMEKKFAEKKIMLILWVEINLYKKEKFLT